MQACKFCGKFILTSYNQHLAIAHPREWDKIKKEWVRLKNEGLSAQEIAERYDTNSATVSRAIKESYSIFYKMQRHKNTDVGVVESIKS
ncbi:MAG: helix-turn-helix domain-containing protein [archaeon]|nr:helix-turn-helix domain-containing protein [archaeon]